MHLFARQLLSNPKTAHFFNNNACTCSRGTLFPTRFTPTPWILTGRYLILCVSVCMPAFDVYLCVCSSLTYACIFVNLFTSFIFPTRILSHSTGGSHFSAAACILVCVCVCVGPSGYAARGLDPSLSLTKSTGGRN